MYDVRDVSMLNAEHYTRFDNVPTAKALVDTRRIKLLWKIVRDKVSLPSYLLLIAFASHSRATG